VLLIEVVHHATAQARSSNLAHSLQALARGDLDVTTGEKEVSLFLDATGDLGQVYSAFTTLLWHAVSERRKDNELRHWHRLIEDIAFRARKDGKGDLSERLRGLADVLSISIAMSDRPTKVEVLKRAHVPEILQALAGSLKHRLSRAELRERVPLQSANMSRLLTLLALCGLVERHQSGKEASFQLTEAGIACVRQPKVEDSTRVSDVSGSPVFVKRKALNRKGKAAKVSTSVWNLDIQPVSPGEVEVEFAPVGALKLAVVPSKEQYPGGAVSGSSKTIRRELLNGSVGL
jgi:hypothetical protein